MIEEPIIARADSQIGDCYTAAFPSGTELSEIISWASYHMCARISLGKIGNVTVDCIYEIVSEDDEDWTVREYEGVTENKKIAKAISKP